MQPIPVRLHFSGITFDYRNYYTLIILGEQNMIKRIISCIVSTVIVLGATIAYDRTPACRIAVMEQVPTQLASVLPRAASYELELRTEEGSRSYTVNCHDKDGSTFRSYTMQTVEGQEEPLNFTYTDYTYDENGNCTDAITTDKTNNSTSNYRRSYDDKTAFCASENYEDGELSASSETVLHRGLTTVSPLPSTRFTTQTATS